MLLQFTVNEIWTAQPGVFPPSGIVDSRGMSVGDFNNDGFLDVYVGAYESNGYEPDVLYFGDGAMVPTSLIMAPTQSSLPCGIHFVWRVGDASAAAPRTLRPADGSRCFIQTFTLQKRHIAISLLCCLNCQARFLSLYV